MIYPPHRQRLGCLSHDVFPRRVGRDEDMTVLRCITRLGESNVSCRPAAQLVSEFPSAEPDPCHAGFRLSAVILAAGHIEFRSRYFFTARLWFGVS